MLGIGDIYQSFSADGNIENIIKFTVPLILSPRDADDGGMLKVRAKWTSTGDRTIKLRFEEVSVSDLRLSEWVEALIAPALFPRVQLQRDILSWFSDLNVRVPLRNALNPTQSAPAGGFLLTFCVEDVLIGRQQF